MDRTVTSLRELLPGMAGALVLGTCLVGGGTALAIHVLIARSWWFGIAALGAVSLLALHNLLQNVALAGITLQAGRDEGYAPGVFELLAFVIIKLLDVAVPFVCAFLLYRALFI